MFPWTHYGALTFDETNVQPISKLRKTLKLLVDVMTYGGFSVYKGKFLSGGVPKNLTTFWGQTAQ